MAKNYPMLTTPKGMLIYPHLVEPDTKYVKPDGEYHTKFALDAGTKATNDFVAKLAEVMDGYIEANEAELKPAQIKNANRAEFFEVEYDDDGEETGRLLFKFKLKAKVVTKTKEWEQAPRLFDSKAQPIVGELSFWTGTIGKVSVEVFPYYMGSSKTFGLSLRCKAVQLLDIVEGSGGGGESYGFAEEEGGFVDESTGAANGFDEEAGEEDGEADF